MSWLVTGLGAVASLGGDANEVFEALYAGRSGLAELRGFDRDRFRARHGYEIDDRPEDGADLPGRATRWLLKAIEDAARDSGLGTDLHDVPILIGSGLRELRSLELWWRGEATLDVAELHFGTALRERFAAATTYTLANACSASLCALALGLDLVSLDAADTVIIAGVDSITESMHGLLDRVSPQPPDTVRPFDQRRKGAVMGDGAAAIVVQREDSALTATARGRLRAVSMNCDATHPTAPDPHGIAMAIRDAHTRAGIKPEDVDLVLLHGTGTLLNDAAEARALGEVFGAHAGRPLMTALKSMIGHTSGGSGLQSLIVALQALESGRVPPTVGLTDPLEEAAGFRFVRRAATATQLEVAQVNAFGFGGVNAVAIVERTAR